MLKHGYISLTGVEDMEFPNKAHIYVSFHVINPRRACAARVTVVGLSVCLSVCPLVNISLLERLFVLKTLSHTQRATKIKKYVAGCTISLHIEDPKSTNIFSQNQNTRTNTYLAQIESFGMAHLPLD